MTASEFRAWMERAFLAVEGKLLIKSAHESPTRIAEEIVREAMIDGLKAAKPNRTQDVHVEVMAPWNTSPDVIDPNRPLGQGRPIQHDIAIRHGAAIEAICEVKWLKSSDANAILKDLWKLSLTHGTANRPVNCPRSFLLMGGMKKPFQDTLKALRRQNVPMRWSPQGRAKDWPQPTTIRFGPLANQQGGFNALKAVLRRRDNYHRSPPEIWWEMRCSALSRSYRTIREAEWKVVLWELDFRKPCRSYRVNWEDLRDYLQ